MVALLTAFLLCIGVVTASVFQRADTNVTPDAFVANSFDYVVVGKDPTMLCTTS